MSTTDPNILNSLQRARMPKAKKATAPLSKRSEKMQEEMKLYKKQVTAYLSKEENQICLIQSTVCKKIAVAVNHKRRRGKNLRNEKDWEPCCAPCNLYIEEYPEWAIENGHLISPHIHQTQETKIIQNDTIMENKDTVESILALPGTKSEKIKKLKEIGKTNKEIAELVGSNQGHVWNVLNPKPKSVKEK